MALWEYPVLTLVGFAAGVINMLAGGGSNLTLPVMMVMGMPPQIANATNRVGVVLQSIVGAQRFHRAGHLALSDLPLMLVPILTGSLFGALLAAYMSPALLKPALLLTMLTVAAITLFRPSVVMPPEGTLPRKMRETPAAWGWLFFAGVYGGFVQAGVGFVLLTAVAGSLRYDLKRANALKVVTALFLTAFALLVFALRGQVDWGAGLALALGNALGAVVGVKLTLDMRPITLKRILFAMTVVAVVMALFSHH